MSHDKDNDPVEEVDRGYQSDEDDDDLDDEPVTPIELACIQRPGGELNANICRESFDILDRITRPTGRMVEDVILEALQLLVEQKPQTYGGNGAWESASPYIGEEYKVVGIFSLTGKERTAFTYHLACSDHRNSDHGGFLRDYIRNHTSLLRMPDQRLQGGDPS